MALENQLSGTETELDLTELKFTEFDLSSGLDEKLYRNIQWTLRIDPPREKVEAYSGDPKKSHYLKLCAYHHIFPAKLRALLKSVSKSDREHISSYAARGRNLQVLGLIEKMDDPDAETPWWYPSFDPLDWPLGEEWYDNDLYAKLLIDATVPHNIVRLYEEYNANFDGVKIRLRLNESTLPLLYDMIIKKVTI